MSFLYVLTGNNSNEDAFFKDFMDKLEDEPEVAEELEIIRFTCPNKNYKFLSLTNTSL